MIRIWITILLILIPLFVGSNTLPDEARITLSVKKETKIIDPMQRYYDLLGETESNNDYQVINRFGYMGKYQFGKSTLRLLKSKGLLEITDNQIHNFIHHPELQEEAVRVLTEDNRRVLKRYGLDKYIGKTIMGTKITMNGMLAGSHLLGVGAVNQFVKSNGRIIKKDGNNTTVLDYMEKFEGV